MEYMAIRMSLSVKLQHWRTRADELFDVLQRLANMFQDDQYLTQDNRRRMNELVDSVNAKLVGHPPVSILADYK